MNEELLRCAVRFKLETAEKFMNRLPQETIHKLRAYVRIIFDTVGETLAEQEPEKARNTGKTHNLNNVKID
jgi:hypothetical protein